ncbi:MAG: 3-keto-5-aminohexanoate cleavage protein, partial [Tumebacillaceae bacterium]
ELEIFEAGMITNALRLAKKGLLSGHLHFDLVLGVPGAIAGTPENLLHLVRMLPEDATWTVAGVGRAQLPLNTMGIVLGGHVRVGFEDNIYLEKGVLATSNADFVARIARIAKEVGRDVARPADARKILGLPL